MWQMFSSSMMLVTFLFAPQFVVAQEPPKDGPPGPEMLFGRLDANQDGVISEDEMPAEAPEPLKALLKAADKDGDKKVSQDEFSAAIKEHPLPRPPFGKRGEHGQPPCQMPPPGAPGKGFGPPQGGPQGKAPDLKELFEQFDKSKDGTLTQEEFTEGMKQLHKTMMEHARPMAGMPGQGGPMPHRGPGPGMRGRPTDGDGPRDRQPGENPPPDFRKDGKAFKNRVDELEAKVEALEAKLEGK